MKEKKEILYWEIDRVLWEEWDPIGVNNSENIKDEYRTYVNTLHHKLLVGEDYKNVSEHLYKLETLSMGCEGNMERCAQVAKLLLGLKNKIYSNSYFVNLYQELEYQKQLLKDIDTKLHHKNFIKNTPKSILKEEHQKKADTEAKIKALEERLGSL